MRTNHVRLVLLLLVFSACCFAQQVQTVFATNITSTNAMLNGVVAPTTGAASCHFNWNSGGVTASLPLMSVISNGPALFSQVLIGILPGQNIFYQLECEPIAGGSFVQGQFMQFVVPAIIPPAFMTTQIQSAGAPALPGISPGEIVSIYGANLSAVTMSAPAGTLPSSLGGVTVSFGGMFGAVAYVSPTQINVQAPFAIPYGGTISVTIAVDHGGGLVLSSTASVTIASANPGIFGYTDLAGHNLAAPGVTLSPSSDGGFYMTIYGTGIGAVSNWSATGVPAPNSSLVTMLVKPVVTADNLLATVLFAGLAPNTVGVWQVNVKLPALSPGVHIVELTAPSGGSVSFTIAVAASSVRE